MSAKSSGGVLGTLVLAAFLGWQKIAQWQRESRMAERMPSIRETLAAEHARFESTRAFRESLGKSVAADKARFESMCATGRRGDFEGALAVCTNIPGGANAEQQKDFKAIADFIQRFDAFVAEFDARSPAEGLDLDLMLSPRFVCGVDGFESSLRRVDRAISLLNEVEERMKGFMKDKDALPTAKTTWPNPFDLTPQWKRMTDALTSSFEVRRQIAGQIKKLVVLHRDHPQDWKLDAGEVLYYDPYLCDQVDSARAEVLKLVKRQRFLESVMSATQQESFSKLGKAFDKAVSR